MKTPDEIKTGLECCSNTSGTCEDCPYVEGECRAFEQPSADALALIQQLEAQVPRWISATNPPKKWKHDDKEQTLVNYLIYTPEYGVDVGNYLEPAKRWVLMGLPVKVTHWMPLPEPPKEDSP